MEETQGGVTIKSVSFHYSYRTGSSFQHSVQVVGLITPGPLTPSSHRAELLLCRSPPLPSSLCPLTPYSPGIGYPYSPIDAFADVQAYPLTPLNSSSIIYSPGMESSLCYCALIPTSPSLDTFQGIGMGVFSSGKSLQGNPSLYHISVNKDLNTSMIISFMGIEVQESNQFGKPELFEVRQVKRSKEKRNRHFSWSFRIKSINAPFYSQFEVFLLCPDKLDLHHQDTEAVFIKLQNGNRFVQEKVCLKTFLESPMALMLSDGSKAELLEKANDLNLMRVCELEKMMEGFA